MTAWRVASPGGRLVATIASLPLDPSHTRRLYCRVELDAIEALGWSPLGVRTAAESFVEGLILQQESAREIDESYSTLTGKRRPRHVRARERTLRFANSNGAEIELVVRVSDDGVAWRHRLLGEGEATMIGEESGFAIPRESRAWLAPYDRATQFAPAYEQHFEAYAIGQGSPQNGFGYGALFRISEKPIYVLLAEADLDASYVGTHLADPIGNVYRIAFPGEGEGNGVGNVHPTAKLPWMTPWRVAVIGDLPTVFGSTLVDDLSRPPAGDDREWIRPGRSAWSWFSQGTGDLDLQRQYVDFAAEMAWEYVLVDAHWDEWAGGDDEVRALIDYAAERSVRIVLWYNSGGAHNVVPEPPRDRMLDPEIRRRELDRIAGWGVAGIKVDFFQSEKQDRIAQYLAILEDALPRRLLVNFHGSTLPRGWQRTYPHLMTMEGVRGAEYYKFTDPPGAIHNVRLALTRNVVGSMDYTPVTFGAAWKKRGITFAHQVALAIVFESGVQHFAERADANPEKGFRRVFAEASFLRDFFREIPTVWDESILLDGSPDSHVVIARRHGDRWYIAGLSGLDEPLQLEVDLRFLGEGSHTFRVITSGGSPTELIERSREIAAGEPLVVELAAKDGFVAIAR